ncbi:hypothetical protein HJC23_008097 [Cyclotella cryptica]|uniref:Glutamate decarboxylase n=1 Tax=Cyclotella cryptica TaxID=29204 RepID=A0ABD3PFI2_9STRA|eukprot:CCRYP_014998-RB/>CCRYP_014998-RB protein AED:0.13 eAED:0.13 QI:236/1/1/1/0.5/0.33/3/3351/799
MESLALFSSRVAACEDIHIGAEGGISLSFPVFFVLICFVFLIGGIVGFCTGSRWQQQRNPYSGSYLQGARDFDRGKIGSDESTEGICDGEGGLLTRRCLISSSASNSNGHESIMIDNSNKKHLTPPAQDGPTHVLLGSLRLLSSLWNHKNGVSSTSKVVNYLSPQQMNDLLFSGSNSLSLDDHDCIFEVLMDSKDRLKNPSPRSSAVDVSAFAKSELLSTVGDDCNGNHNNKIKHNNNNTVVDTTNANKNPSSFLELLSLLQKYSVNTSHPYFFNQLFGSLDPIALAAEIVALSVNTSVYTYETAPVFTLLEREVMRMVGRLVFCTKEALEDGSHDEFEGEGLMIPGGSLANLTAMHAARHRWKVRNGFVKTNTEATVVIREAWMENENREEEKKFDDASMHGQQQDYNLLSEFDSNPLTNDASEEPALVAFVSSEAHYSFSKSARVLGIRDVDLIVIPTHADGSMDVSQLAKRIEELELELSHYDGCEATHRKQRRRRVPFFVACTAGSTVRGSFDDIASIVQVCCDYESRGNSSNPATYQRTIWVHVDGAWGGSAIFSSRPSLRSVTQMDAIRHADSFTFNPHKMLGAPQQTTAFIVRHRNALRNANAAGARYLFDPRKNGAEYDLGDLSYTCGRRTDAVKLWAMWKYYGREGLGARVDQKVDELQLFVRELRKRPSFALACKPWPFNVNFFYFPPRIRQILEARGIRTFCASEDEEETLDGNHFVQIPDDIAEDLANVSVNLKLRLHEAGEMIIPYQPLNNQKADCFRLVIAGKKKFDLNDICHVLDTMEKYGSDL